MIKKIGLLLSMLLITMAAQASVVELTTTNFVALTEEVNGTTVSDTILALEKNKSPIVYLYINSPGGSVQDGILLVNYLLDTKKKIVCIASFAASMAHAILEACPVRLATPTNILLQHRAASQAQGSVPELKAVLSILEGLENYLNELEAKRIGLPIKVFKEKVNPIWVTFGQDSVAQNIIDGLTNVTCSPELYAKSTNKTVHSLFGTVDLVINGCPLLEPQVNRSSER